MSYLGGATLSWQSDYAQFYLVDDITPGFNPPTDITPEMMSRRWHPMTPGLVVYTNDCLHQLIEIQIYDAEPAAVTTDWRSGKAWTQVESAALVVPSKQFTLSSPSKGGASNYRPIFRADATTMAIRIHWLEFAAGRYDNNRAEPDVIRLDLWPA